MDNLATVKKNMLQAYISISNLNQSMKQLISSLSNTNVSNLMNISNLGISTINNMNLVVNDIDTMYKLNAKELHIFFKEFNEETKRIINIFPTIFKIISEIVKEVVREYFIYNVSMNVVGDRTTIQEPNISLNDNLTTYVNRLETFRIQIDIHNNKLKGGRSR